MASPPLRSNFTNWRTPTSAELSATEYNLNATRTDAAFDSAAAAQSTANSAQSTANSASSAAAAAQTTANSASTAAAAAQTTANTASSTATAAQTTANAAVPKNSLFKIVTDYGAVGTANDTATVTAAINAAVAARASFPGGAAAFTKSVVWFPPGTYLFGAITLPDGIYLDGDSARLRPTAGFTGNWITITGRYAGLLTGVWLNGNNNNGEVAVKITTTSWHARISASMDNWAGKCVRCEGFSPHIDSPYISGMLNTTYINSLTAGSYVGVVEIAGNDTMVGKVEINASRTSGGNSVVPSTNKVVVALLMSGGMNMVDGAICEQADIGIYSTGFFNKFKNTRTEFNTTHGFWAPAGSGEIIGCQALGNSRATDNTYDGFFIDNGNFWIFDDNYSASDNPGDSINHRYGLHSASPNLVLGKFISHGGDGAAYRDAVAGVTYATPIESDPHILRIRDAVTGGTSLTIYGQASAVNHLYINNGPAGVYPLIGAEGGDPNIDIGFTPQGTGGLKWYQPSGSSINFNANGAAADVDWNFGTKGAGLFKVNSVNVPTVSSTDTLTNKRITPRVNAAASNATPALDPAYRATVLTAQAAAITAFSLASAFTAEQSHTVRIKDNGTARAITWTSAVIQAADGVTLPTTTVVGKTHRIECVYDEVVGKLVAMSVASY